MKNFLLFFAILFSVSVFAQVPDDSIASQVTSFRNAGIAGITKGKMADAIQNLNDSKISGQSWTTGKTYNANKSFVIQSNIIYKCLVTHTAGTFSTDLSGNKWVAISNSGGGSSLPTTPTLSGTTGTISLSFSGNKNYKAFTQTGNITFTPATDTVEGGRGLVVVNGDGSHSLSFSGGSWINANGNTFDNTKRNRISYWYTSGEYVYNIVKSNAPDVTAPVISSAATNSAGTQITLTYSETLGSATPANSDFTPSGSKTVTAVSVSGSTVVLTISSAYATGATITISYTPGTNKIQDVAGNFAAALTNQSVTNNVVSNILVENFNKTDNSSSLGSASTGQPWVPVVGTWGISSNQAYCSSALTTGSSIINIATIDPAASNYTFTFDVTNFSTGSGASDNIIFFRYSDQSNHYIIDIAYNGGTGIYGIGIYKNAAGAGYVSVGTGAYNITQSAGTLSFKLITSGSSIQLLQYNSGTSSYDSKITGTDSFNSTATKIGVGLSSGSSVTNVGGRFDNFILN